MQLITIEDARVCVVGLKDRLGRPVDSGIAEALAEFIRVTEALGFKTVQSCEGHIDWGLPFPWIDFEVADERIPLPPLWKMWRHDRRRSSKRENEKHARNAEKKTDQLCYMLTRFLIQYDAMHSTDPETVLHIHRWQRFRFRLMPARSLLSESYKLSADHKALNDLLHRQRATFKSFAKFYVEMLKLEQNLIGIPEEGCRGCMGRG